MSPRARAAGLAPALVVCAAALVALLGDACTGATVFAYRDAHRVYLPARRWLVERLGRGEWPEWYPLDGLGGSFVGQVVTGAFHPTSLLHLVLPRVWAFNLSVALAHVAALSGMALLLRLWKAGRAAGLAAGLAFSVSGYLVSMEANLPYLLAAAALPWALWGVEAAGHGDGGGATPKIVAALALASMVLAGDPQTSFLAAALCLVVALAPAKDVSRRASLQGLAIVAALACLLSAVQLLPALSGFSELGLADRGWDEAKGWSLEPLRLFDLVVPQPFNAIGRPPVELFGLKDFQSLWADSLFVGAPVLSLALAAALASTRRREVRLLGAIAALGLLISLGAHTPLYGLLQHLPAWRGFRYPEKTMGVVTFALAGLCGLGVEAALDSARARRALVVALLGCLGAATACALLGQGGGLEHWATTDAARAELREIGPSVARQGLVGAWLALGALLLCAVFARRAPTWTAAALVAMVGLTCLLGNRGLSRSYRVEPEVAFAPPRVLDQMRQIAGELRGRARFYAFDERQVYPQPAHDRAQLARMMVRFDVANLARGMSAEFGVEGIVGYLPLTTGGRVARADEVLPDEVYLRAFNARFLVERVEGAATIDESFRVRELPGAGARIRLVQAIAAGSEAEVAQRVRAPGFDPVAQAVVEATGFPADPPREGQLTVVRYDDEHVEVVASSQTPCALFVADRFAPGWTATIDGARAEISPADLVGRAVALPAGKHRVEMSYRAPGLRTGAALSLLGLVGCVGLSLSRRWPRRTSRERPRQS